MVQNGIKDAVEFDKVHTIEIGKQILESGMNRVGIMGISYKEDTKIDKASPAILLINFFQET